MAGVADYATTTDVGALLPTVDAAVTDNAILTRFLHVASRAVDRYCDRFFYSDGVATKYFTIQRDNTNRFWLPFDAYSVTAVKVALQPNADPATSSQWTTISGDGITPPSNFILLPQLRPYVGANANATALAPYYGIELPDTANPNDSTNYLSQFTKGINTLSIAASWGWPAIPDDIVQVTAKIAARLYRSREMGFTGTSGLPDLGQTTIIKFLDASDFAVLEFYKRHSV